MFAAYPALRPYSTEVGMAGAEAFASDRWVIAHVCAMLGFIAVAFAVRSLSTTGKASRTAAVATAIGAGLVLPYYGAEAFALHAIGVRAVAGGDAELITLADPIRYGAIGMTMFAAGLALLAVGAVAAAMAARGRFGIVYAAAFLLFLPQFYSPPAIRIAHGVLLLLGCLLMAYSPRAHSPRKLGERFSFKASRASTMSELDHAAS